MAGKKIIIILAVVLGIVMASITAFVATAAEVQQAQIVSQLTNRSVNSVLQESYQTNKTFGQIADEAGKKDAFREELTSNKKNIEQKKILSGQIWGTKARLQVNEN